LEAKEVTIVMRFTARPYEWGRYRLKIRVSAVQVLASDPFIYFGSYFKGTKVADVDEFDVLVVIDSQGGQYSQGGKVIGHGLGSA
jgi:hypothetical protein